MGDAVVAEGMPILTRDWLVEHTITVKKITSVQKMEVATKIDPVTALKNDSTKTSQKI